MKIKLTNYDSSDYKLLELKLNQLSNQGYNCNSVDIFTIFKHDNKRFYYQTDIFIPNKNITKNNRKQREDWLMNYLDHGYKFIGKVNKIYVFKANKKVNINNTDKKQLLTYFKKNKTLYNIFYVFISLFLAFLLIPNVFINNDPNEFVTNGAILIHYAPLFLCIALLVKFFNNYLKTEKLKQSLIKETLPAYSKYHEYSFILSNWLIIISVIIILGGFGLDAMERQNILINDQILTLKDLGMSNKQNDTYTKSSSLMIKEAYSYFDNNDDLALKTNYYRFSSNSKAKKYLNNFLNQHQFNKKKQIANGYLLSNHSNYDTILFTKDNQLIIIYTTFDLLENDLYQKILNFNY